MLLSLYYADIRLRRRHDAAYFHTLMMPDYLPPLDTCQRRLRPLMLMPSRYA